MNSSASVWRADFRPQVSRWLIGVMLLAHVLAAMAVAAAYIPLLVKLPCWVLLPYLAWRSLKPLRLQTPDSVTAFREYGEDWWLDTADGVGRRVVLLPALVLWRYLLVLRFVEPGPAGRGRHYSVPVLPDSLAPDDLRRLYVRLRLRSHGRADASVEDPE